MQVGDPCGSLSLADSLVGLPLGFTAYFSLIFWSEEKEKTARSLGNTRMLNFQDVFHSKFLIIIHFISPSFKNIYNGLTC